MLCYFHLVSSLFPKTCWIGRSRCPGAPWLHSAAGIRFTNVGSSGVLVPMRKESKHEGTAIRCGKPDKRRNIGIEPSKSSKDIVIYCGPLDHLELNNEAWEFICGTFLVFPKLLRPLQLGCAYTRVKSPQTVCFKSTRVGVPLRLCISKTIIINITCQQIIIHRCAHGIYMNLLCCMFRLRDLRTESILLGTWVKSSWLAVTCRKSSGCGVELRGCGCFSMVGCGCFSMVDYITNDYIDYEA